jgi:hypothetical protein
MSDFCIYPHSGIPQGLKALILVNNPLRESWFEVLTIPNSRPDLSCSALRLVSVLNLYVTTSLLVPHQACKFHWDRTKLRFFKMVAMVAILDVTWPPISAWMILIGPPTSTMSANFIETGQSWGFSRWFLWWPYWMSRCPQFRHGRSLLVPLPRLRILLRLDKVEVQDSGYGGHIGCHVAPNFSMDAPYWSPYHACEFHWDWTRLRFKIVAMVAILDVTLPPISAWTILVGPPTTPENFIEIGRRFWVDE